ncbi:hypothetical protein GQ43DRAFT_366502 [Delitschia confertaspora ATCC 74209]|uniref:Tudor domain-containing protein n=1 Tax=Delitschia confertaspora ATCC 74209 TaxID=1513339 RepID=A0A9P4JQB4_9PLEO|nr:hypothetical protein GQ43DRAFT_366502 [Delitschia confertaspora ATCC 74209]
MNDCDVKITDLQERLQAAEAAAGPEAQPKWVKEDHPLYRKPAEPEAVKPIVYNVGDMVEAKWTDRMWYKAKIAMVIGSAENPKYNVRFIDYKDSSLTVDREQVRPLHNDKKRKTDAAPVTQSPYTPTPQKTGPVISAGPNIKPIANTAGKEAESADGEDRPQKKKKIGNNKQLQASKQKWQDFQKKGPKGMVKKDSMFRTGAAPTARVGFTGSGVPMQKDVTRSRNTYERDDHRQDRDDYGDDDGEDVISSLVGVVKRRGPEKKPKKVLA